MRPTSPRLASTAFNRRYCEDEIHADGHHQHLPKCLDSPYLIQDKDAHLRVGSLMATAADRLEAAANINYTGQGDPADVSFLSYEAMFSCLRALVYNKGYREMGLRCLMLACEHLYVKTGLLEPVHVHAFERAQGLKNPPAENLAAASAFVKRTLEILAQA